MGPFLIGFGAALGFAAWRAEAPGAGLIVVALLVVAFIFGRRVAIASAVASAVAVAVSKAEAAASAQAMAQVQVYLAQNFQAQEGPPVPLGAGGSRPLEVDRVSLTAAPLAIGGVGAVEMEDLRRLLDRRATPATEVGIGVVRDHQDSVLSGQFDGAAVEERSGD